MKKTVIITLALLLVACNQQETSAEKQTAAKVEATEQAEVITAQQEPERTYIGEHNYYVEVMSEDVTYRGVDLDVQYQKFPQYFISRAKEWPKEDLNNASSYDMPRLQFVWANLPYDHPDGNKYESEFKLWSIKTDGTDLRLVTDIDVGDSIRNISRSPNNRYIAWVSSGWKYVYDLQQGTTTFLAKRGSNAMVWSEDSRYFYFENSAHGHRYSRWDSLTGEIKQTELKYSTASIIKDGVLINVGDFGVTGHKISDNSKVFGIYNDDSLSIEQGHLKVRAVSPNGRYARGANSYAAWHFDIENRSVTEKKENRILARILGKDARYSKSNSGMGMLSVVDREKLKVWYWKPLSIGRLSGDATLYNGLANNGLWFKEAN